MFTRKNIILCVVTLLFVLTTQGSIAAPPPPNPVLYLLRQEYFDSGGKNFVRFRFDVLNKDLYPNDMFVKSPELPACGTNTQSARTWVDVYDMSGKRLNGFCALQKPSDLGTIWFALESDKIPPSWVYIELNDRKTGTKYKSNLADTTL